MRRYWPGSARALLIRKKSEQVKRLQALLPESQSQNLAVTAFHVPSLLDSFTFKNARPSFSHGACFAQVSRAFGIAPEDMAGRVSLVFRQLHLADVRDWNVKNLGPPLPTPGIPRM